MQIPSEWVVPIISLIGMFGSLIIFVATRIVAQKERTNIAEQVSLYRKTQLENRLIDVIAEAHQFIQSIQASLRWYIKQNNKGLSAPSYATDLGLEGDIIRDHESLIGLSYRCGIFGDEIREVCRSIGAFITQKMPLDIASLVLEEVKSLEIKMTKWLERVLTEGLQSYLSD